MHPWGERKIIHVDMDAFFASIEMRDDPTLQGKPIAVGGLADRRGVIATANYEARRFGVRSAMATQRALKLCPTLILKPSRFDAYRHEASVIRQIFKQYTDLVEPLSLDEAYLDVTESCNNATLSPYASEVAKSILKDIKEATNLTASAGVSCNKLLAKIGSDYRKPAGLTVIHPQKIRDFLAPQAIQKIPGVGPVTGKRLASLGIHTFADVQRTTEADLVQKLGDRLGSWLKERGEGIDHRQVKPNRVRKSLGHETTFPKDLRGQAEVSDALRGIMTDAFDRLKKASQSAKTITLKVRYSNFDTITRSVSMKEPVEDLRLLWQTTQGLLEKTEGVSRPVRLLGLSFSSLEPIQGRTPIRLDLRDPSLRSG